MSTYSFCLVVYIIRYICFFKECARRFPLNLCGSENIHKEEKYVMSIPPDQLKCVVSLAGDTITQAVSKL